MNDRISWIDCLKGASIILVVLYHAPQILEESAWLVDMINYKMRPIRMPAFFLASGMLTAFALQRNWPSYLSRRVGPLVYSFAVWTLVTFCASYALPAPHPVPLERLPQMFLIPRGVLWFVAELAVFALAVRLFARHPAATVALAAIYAILFWDLASGNRMLNGLRYFVFFAAGAYFQPLLRNLLEARPGAVAVGTAAVWLAVTLSPLPNESFAMSVVGVAGFASVIILTSRTPLRTPLSFAGANSVSIYLMHWLLMTNLALLPTWPAAPWSVVTLAAAGVVVPVLVRPLLPDLLFALPTRAVPRPS